ncbi:unnamed protein product, partial [Discosporangium mesarthrocarpum]
MSMKLSIDEDVDPRTSCLVVYLAEGAHHYFEWVSPFHVHKFEGNVTHKTQRPRAIDFKAAEIWAARLQELRDELRGRPLNKLSALPHSKRFAAATPIPPVESQSTPLDPGVHGSATRADDPPRHSLPLPLGAGGRGDGGSDSVSGELGVEEVPQRLPPPPSPPPPQQPLDSANASEAATKAALGVGLGLLMVAATRPVLPPEMSASAVSVSAGTGTALGAGAVVAASPSCSHSGVASLLQAAGEADEEEEEEKGGTGEGRGRGGAGALRAATGMGLGMVSAGSENPSGTGTAGEGEGLLGRRQQGVHNKEGNVASNDTVIRDVKTREDEDGAKGGGGGGVKGWVGQVHPLNKGAFSFSMEYLECPWLCPGCRLFTAECSCPEGLPTFLRSGRRSAPPGRYSRFDCHQGCSWCTRCDGLLIHMAEWGVRTQLAAASPCLPRPHPLWGSPHPPSLAAADFGKTSTATGRGGTGSGGSGNGGDGGGREIPGWLSMPRSLGGGDGESGRDGGGDIGRGHYGTGGSCGIKGGVNGSGRTPPMPPGAAAPFLSPGRFATLATRAQRRLASDAAALEQFRDPEALWHRSAARARSLGLQP